MSRRSGGSGMGMPSVTDPPWNAKCDGITDDTTAVQAAMNDLSVIGANNRQMIPLRFPPERTCVISSTIPKSYVDIWAYGAILKRNPVYATNHSLFFASAPSGVGAGISNFAIRGAAMHGNGAENFDQGLLLIDRSTNLTVEDCIVDNVAATIVQIQDSQGVWCDRNNITNCGFPGGPNIFHFGSGANGNTIPLKNVWARGNFIGGTCPVLGISFVGTQTSNRTDPIVDGHVTDNIVYHTGGGWPIAVEQGGTTPPANVSTFDISGNTVYNNGTNANPYGIATINDSSTLSNDPMLISDVTIRGNHVYSQVANGLGILVGASHAQVSGNQVWATVDDIRISSHGTAILHHISVTGNNGWRGTGLPVTLFGGSNPADPLTTTISGNPRIGLVTVTVPASGTAVTYKPYNRIFYVTAGTGGCTMTRQDGAAIVVPAGHMGTVRVPAGQTVTPTYTTAPTWTVEGE